MPNIPNRIPTTTSPSEHIRQNIKAERLERNISIFLGLGFVGLSAAGIYGAFHIAENGIAAGVAASTIAIVTGSLAAAEFYDARDTNKTLQADIAKAHHIADNA